MIKTLLTLVCALVITTDSGYWTDDFSARKLRLPTSSGVAIDSKLGWIVLDKEGHLSLDAGSKSLPLFNGRSVTHFSTVQLDKNKIVVVAEVFQSDNTRSYEWAVVLNDSVASSPSVLTQGSIIEGTDPLTLVAMAGKNDELVVTLVDSEPIPLSDRHLVFHYSHRCLAPGVKGSLNRMFINDDGLKEFIGNSYGSYKKTVSSK